jgi:hypothetical protein
MMIKITQKKWPFLLVVFFFVGLLITFILRLITPSEVVIPKSEFITTNSTGDSTNFDNIRFTGNFILPVASLPLLTIQPSQTTLDYVREQLIENYQLDQVVGVSGLWRGKTHVLSYNEYEDEFIFYKNIAPDDSLIQESQSAIRSATTFVQATFPNLSLVAQLENIIYFQGLEELEETTPAQASAVQVSFTYFEEGVPVYLEHEKTATITVIINSFYEVQKVVFQPHFINIVPSKQKINLIDLGTALENINQRNEASIISAFETEAGLFSLEQVKSGTLTSATLEYRGDLENNFAYPFYRFSGELTNQAGQTIQAEIITPAISTR